MTPTEIRQKLHQQIDQIPADWLGLVAEFLDFLTFKTTKTIPPAANAPQLEREADSAEPILTGSTGADLLPFVGTWQGDDFEDCLQAVYETRSAAEF